jgi:hypothetical protein
MSLPLQDDANGTQLEFNSGAYDAKLNAGVMSLGGAIVSSTVAAALVPINLSTTAEPTVNPLTHAKVFLEVNDVFSVSSSGSTIFGNNGLEPVTLGAMMTNIMLDQNIEKIILTGASSNYTFLQTGNKINIYDTTGTTPIAAMPVQDDADGTLISFSNGNAAAKLTAGVMNLGSASLGSTIAPANPFLSAGFNVTSVTNTNTNKDTLTDFVSGTDSLQFSKAVFAGISTVAGVGAGTVLATSEFVSSSTATSGTTTTSHFIYNTTSGILYYDADANVAGAAVQVALIGTSTHPSLSFADFHVVA